MGIYRNNNGVAQNLTPTAPGANGIAFDNSTTGLPTNVQGALDKTTGNISSLDTVELTTTATHAHAVGSTFLWIGQLVKTTVAIAVGDTIADSGVGANVEATSILDVISELNAANIAYNNTSSGLTATDVQDAVDEINDNINSLFPAMAYNTEYKTKEFFLGKPVYAYLWSYGYLEAGNSISLTLPTDVSSNIKCGVDVLAFTNTNSNDVNTKRVVFSQLQVGSFPDYANNTKLIIGVSQGPFGHVAFLLKYTKTTD